MPARLNRALQVRTAERLRATLARDDFSGLPLVGALSEADQRELREVGGGRLSAIVIRVAWLIDSTPDRRSLAEVESTIVREVAARLEVHVRRTDLLAAVRHDALVILAPALDPVSGVTVAARIRQVLTGLTLEVGVVQVELRVAVGVASRSTASAAGWTAHTLADEAERNATTIDPPPVAIVA